MPTPNPTPPIEKPGFTTRAAIIAIFLTLFLLGSSSYIAIKLGVVPWPIIFSVIVSGGIIKVLSRGRAVDMHEINVAQAGASIGGLVSAGVIFTIPGIIYLNQTRGLHIPWPDPYLLALGTIVAGLLGVLLSVPLKTTFVDQEKLPYPSGMAGAELLKLGKTGGKMLFAVTVIGALAAIFALLRDLYFPAGWALTGLAAAGFFITLYPLPMAIGSGYILGEKASLSWFGGAVIGWLLIVPILFNNGFDAEASRQLVQNLGMGLVLGSGIGFFIGYIVPRVKSIFLPVFQNSGKMKLLYPLYSLISIIALVVMQVPLLAAVLAVLFVWMMVAVAARMTGETNIDPLEQFGIFVGLVIALVYSLLQLELSMSSSFIIVMFVSVACAIAGDAGHDYKSAAIVGTRFRDIVKIDLITVVVAGAAAPFVLELIRTGFADTLFTQETPAPQAQLVAGSIFGFTYPKVFIAGFVIAFVFEMVNLFLPPRLQNKALLMPLGIGLFLGLRMAIPLAIGALIKIIIDKKYGDQYHTGILVAAGIMGGEGIAGFLAAGLTTAGLAFATGVYILLIPFTLLAILAAVLYWRRS